MIRGKLYVIVQTTKAMDTFFYFLHEDKKDISPEFTSLEKAAKFNSQEIEFIRFNFANLFKDGKIRIKEISFSL